MPTDLLTDLETNKSAEVSLANIEDLVRVVARDLGRAIEGMRGSAHTFQSGWRSVVLDVARGKTDEMHALRPRMVAAFEKRLGLLKQTLSLAKWYRGVGSGDVPDPDELLDDIVGMERLKADVFDRWRTPEDLEALAARDYSLTTADLETAGQQRRPPASWYAEQSRPF